MWRYGNRLLATGVVRFVELDWRALFRMVEMRRDVPGRCFSSSPLNGQGRGRKTGNRQVRWLGLLGPVTNEQAEARGSRNSFGGYQ
jgi:hypothetical protein